MKDDNDYRARLPIEATKADALRELRPYIDGGFAGRMRRLFRPWQTREQVRRYLDRILAVHISSLLSHQILPANIDIEEFTDRAIVDARETAAHVAVDRLASKYKPLLLDACRVAYLNELALRKARFDNCPVHSVVDYDEEEERAIERENLLKAREQREQQGLDLHDFLRIAFKLYPTAARELWPDQEPAADTGERPTEPCLSGRMAVEKFKSRLKEAGHRVTNNEISIVAGFKDSSFTSLKDFMNDKCTDAARDAINRVLLMSPEEFIANKDKRTS